ncbi:hypothetical protein [Paenibacillus solanacearum]|nr:hypothetical protein [Paenibacillus solanacearum]
MSKKLVNAGKTRYDFVDNDLMNRIATGNGYDRDQALSGYPPLGP